MVLYYLVLYKFITKMINILTYHKHTNYFSFQRQMLSASFLFAQLQRSLPPVVADTASVSATKYWTERNHSWAVVHDTATFVTVACSASQCCCQLQTSEILRNCLKRFCECVCSSLSWWCILFSFSVDQKGRSVYLWYIPTCVKFYFLICKHICNRYFDVSNQFHPSV